MHRPPSSKHRIQSFPTLPTLPDIPPPATVTETAVFRRSSIRNTPPPLPAISHHLQNIQPLSRPLPPPSTTLFPIMEARTLETDSKGISMGSRTSHGEQYLAGPPITSIHEIKKDNISFLPIGSNTQLPHGIKKIFSETIATNEVIPPPPPLILAQKQVEITVYDPQPGKTVKGYARRNVEIREGFCVKLSNCFSTKSYGLGAHEPSSTSNRACCPCWLITVLSILLLLLASAAALTLYRRSKDSPSLINLDYKCKEGWHYLNGKCYACPAGATWDGFNCVKNSLVISGTTQSKINSRGVLSGGSQGEGETRVRVDKTVENEAFTEEGVQRKVVRMKKEVSERDVEGYHLRRRG